MQVNPLGEVLGRYPEFFDLVDDFTGYVEFFLLQDLVSNAGTQVRFSLPSEGFDRSPLPQNIDEYQQYSRAAMEFLAARNERIAAIAAGERRPTQTAPD